MSVPDRSTRRFDHQTLRLLTSIYPGHIQVRKEPALRFRFRVPLTRTFVLFSASTWEARGARRPGVRREVWVAETILVGAPLEGTRIAPHCPATTRHGAYGACCMAMRAPTRGAPTIHGAAMPTMSALLTLPALPALPRIVVQRPYTVIMAFVAGHCGHPPEVPLRSWLCNGGIAAQCSHCPNASNAPHCPQCLHCPTSPRIVPQCPQCMAMRAPLVGAPAIFALQCGHCPTSPRIAHIASHGPH